MRNLKMLTASAAAALILAACGSSGDDEAQPPPAPETSTVTESAPEPEPTTQTVTETAEPTLSQEERGDEVVSGIMEQTWNESSYEDQELICDGMALMPEEMLDVFMEGMAEEGMADMITREQAREFYESKCF